ncbi:hypothetical protein K438DRAFT_1997588 [Mycena galopus ATCC 62051]|nr:hypothetical protein K438DRAFT_1997588 [Mycena galopus ATCC 62051]
MSYIPTNLTVDELILDVRRERDSHYYCLPPFRGTADREATSPFYLVSQGWQVGVFVDWLEAKASVTGYPDNSHPK